jgi:two-component system, NtrC family, sensor kinase
MAKRRQTIHRTRAVRKRASAGNGPTASVDLRKKNASLRRELRGARQEALQQQTALAEVLEVINASAGDLVPVFDAMLEKATHLCEAAYGMLYRYDGEFFHAVVLRGVPAAFAKFMHSPIRPDPRNALGRLLAGESLVHIPDLRTDAAFASGDPLRLATVNLGGARTYLGVPLRDDGVLIGAIGAYRQEVRPFTDRQVALLQNFAAQAVVAINNARLFEEIHAKTADLQESLQQQTATADVLKVISRSTFDLQMVLQTVIESAARLTEADQAQITRQKDGVFFRAESYGFPDEFTDYVKNVPVVPDRGSAIGRALHDGVVVHIPDVTVDPDYTFMEGQKLGDFRTVLSVPMLREGVPIGVIVLTRQEPRPFTDKQIELATTFADQAAIAIENVRLFDSVEARTRELVASLEDLRAAQDRLVQTEKLASLGQLTAGIAHEIKNPLNFVNNFSALSVELTNELGDVLQQTDLADKIRAEVDELTGLLKDNLEKIVQHGKRADSIVKNMLLHSREGSGERRSADVNALVRESLNLAYHGARAEKPGFSITLEHNLDSEVGAVDLYPQEITRALLNVISNGFYAATRRKVGNETFKPVLSATTRNLGRTIEIRIRDNGTGIPPEVRERMFNPFFTTKPTGEGTGLGLSMTHDIIVKQHGGRIDVETELGVFTELIITLPRGNGTG